MIAAWPRPKPSRPPDNRPPKKPKPQPKPKEDVMRRQSDRMGFLIRLVNLAGPACLFWVLFVACAIWNHNL